MTPTSFSITFRM